MFGSDWNVYYFLGGLVLFLFGLKFSENSLRAVSYEKIKSFLALLTKRSWTTFFAGLSVSALLQSQAATIILAISFLGAGLLTFGSVVYIIIGANIGTTFTPWLISLLWFSFSITKFALPLMVFSGFIYLFFGRHKRIAHAAGIVLGFAIAFFGLWFMKESVSFVAHSFSLTPYLGMPLLVFFLVGLVLTVIMQSSTAMNVINLTALYGGLIGFEHAAVLSLGAELWTTISAVLAWFSGQVIQKRASLIQVFFNLITVFVCGFLLLRPLQYLVLEVLWLSNLPVALAALITLYNVVTAVLVLPFTRFITSLFEKLFPDNNQDFVLKLSFISPHDGSVVVLQTLKRDCLLLHTRVISYILRVMGCDDKTFFAGFADVSELLERIHPTDVDDLDGLYRGLKEYEQQILQFSRQVDKQFYTRKQQVLLDSKSHSVTHAMYAAKYFKDLTHDFVHIRNLSDERIVAPYRDLQRRVLSFLQELNALSPRVALEKRLESLLEKRLQAIRDGSISLLRSGVIGEDMGDAATLLNMYHHTLRACDNLLQSFRELSNGKWG